MPTMNTGRGAWGPRAAGRGRAQGGKGWPKDGVSIITEGMAVDGNNGGAGSDSVRRDPCTGPLAEVLSVEGASSQTGAQVP